MPFFNTLSCLNTLSLKRFSNSALMTTQMAKSTRYVRFFAYGKLPSTFALMQVNFHYLYDKNWFNQYLQASESIVLLVQACLSSLIPHRSPFKID